MATRLLGTLARWNADRGFGFIAPDGGGADVFVHASDMSRIGGAPQVGWRLDFQVRPGKDGRARAFDVQREGLPLTLVPREPRPEPRREAQRAPAPRAPMESPRRRSRRSPMVLLAMLVLGTVGYLVQESSSPSHASGAQTLLPGPAVPDPTTQGFSCDGRTRCPQMKSCEEATWFVQHCAGTEMDGDGDGIPCEQQWCN